MGGKAEPHVLELRIHGIANAPPEKVLGVTRDEIVSAGHDDLGGFWRYKNPPSPPSEDTPLVRTDDDPRIRTEAYSWGNMARSGATAGAVVVAILVQIGWLLTLPFGLCNAAYWTRRITRTQAAAGREWLGGAGSSTIRLFALGLTLLLTSALASVALDFIGTQCYRGAAMCARLPAVFQMLPTTPEGRPLRLLILSLLPLAVVLLVYLITRRARVRYEAGARNWAAHQLGDVELFAARTGEPQPRSRLRSRRQVAEAHEEEREPPLLATPGFWSSVRVGPTTERLHIAAVVALLLGLLAWDRIFAIDARCHELQEFVAAGDDGCAVGSVIAASPFEAALLGVAVGVLMVATFFTAVPTARSLGWIRAGRIAGAAVLLLAIAAFVAYAIKTVVDSTREPAAPAPDVEVFLGLFVVPTALVSLMMVACIAALWWRHSPRGGWFGVIPLLAMALITVGGVVELRGGAAAEGPWTFGWGISVGLLVLALYIGSALVRAQTRGGARFEGWRGFGGTVVLTLSLTSALLLTCMLVLGVRALLTPPIDRSTVEGNWRLFDAGEATGATDAVFLPDELIVPPVYGAFGLAVLVILAIVLLVGLAAAVAGLSRFVLLSTPTIAFPADAGARRRRFDAVRLPAAAYTGRPARIAAPADARDRQVLTARRFAALAHRAEPLVGVLAAASITAITGIVLLGILRADLILAPPGSAALMSTVLVVMVAIATASVGVVVANAASSKERPIGVLWDLLCFLPRAGHPFAPPCYGERVVPEIGTHTLEWLRGPEGRRTPNRKVVLSAHSMGGVLATAAMFAIVNNTGIDDHAPIPARGRVGLVTYGVQLRPYFSRFFPDVLGPDVLGVRPTRAPALFGADPWLEQVRSDAAGTPPEADGFSPHYGPGLREVLSAGEGEPPAWVSLWRRTDHLGFPIFGYRDSSSDDGAGNPVDRGATESDPRSYLWEVATHGNYQFTLQYRAGLQAVIDRLR